MDGTHGTNIYDFKLLTVLVIDEYGEGIPVAWLLANREDSTVLMEFLKEVRRTSGYLAPKWFMSDDADQFFNAWSGVFENTAQRRYCVHGMLTDRGEKPFYCILKIKKLKYKCTIISGSC